MWTLFSDRPRIQKLSMESNYRLDDRKEYKGKKVGAQFDIGASDTK